MKPLRACLILLSSVALAATTSSSAEPAAPVAEQPALIDRLASAIARAVYEEYVEDVLLTVEEQEAAFAALDADTSRHSAEQAREELALLETMGLTRLQISDSRRAVLACAHLSRAAAETILGELARVKADWDLLLAEEVPARKAALVRQIDIAAVAVMPPSGAAPQPPAVPRTAAEILQAASRRLSPNGIASLGGEYHILLDGQRMRAGQTIKVKLDREYIVTLASVSRNSFTLALDGETLVVPME